MNTDTPSFTEQNLFFQDAEDNITPAGEVKHLHAFDFDGTLTRYDTLLMFIYFSCGLKRFLMCFLCHLHHLIMMKAGMMSNESVKQMIFSDCFKGVTLETFNAQCRAFASANKSILRPKGLAKLRQLQAEEATKVLIVSASVTNWVAPFFSDMPHVEVLGTTIEVRDGRLTGRFLSHNCYGDEKVRRILERYPDRTSYHLTAYGDSKGDRAMLNFANEGYYRVF